MKNYKPPIASAWSGRTSGAKRYLHETIEQVDLTTTLPGIAGKVIGLMGYACDAGVKRNQGRPGAAGGPDAIRQMLGRMPNHLDSRLALWDAGNVLCKNDQLEEAQHSLSVLTSTLLKNKIFPIILGGGHDMAYGHFRGIRSGLEGAERIGIINFDAHFDLRSNENGNNSGTPFYQIAREAKTDSREFDYLCLGIRKDANDVTLFQTAEDYGVHFVEREDFAMHELTSVQMILLTFIERVDAVYVSIDLDGFSSAYAPGVSSPSPMGFAPDIVWEALKVILDSGKLCSLDVAELNPKFDIDGCTARLAASLVHSIIHRIPLL